jgi:hypothetical protein
MSRRPIFLVATLILVAAFAGEVAAQGFTIVPNAGLSKDMRSQTSNRWNMGFNVGLNAFVDLPGISVGGRVAYHSWGADGEGWAEDYAADYGSGYSYTVSSSSGSQSVIEIVPSMRFSLLPPLSPAKLHLQLGGGLFIVSPGDVKIDGSFRSAFSSGTASVTFTGESITGYGIQAGLPLTLVGKIQILPLYSLYWAGGDAYHHITINAGIVL